MTHYKTQPPWEFLLTASRNSLQSYELSRLSHAANLRKEITQLLDSWLEENSAAMLARWLMEHRERPAPEEEPCPPEAREPRASARDNSTAYSRANNAHAIDPQPANAQGAEPRFCPTARRNGQVVSDNVFADQGAAPPANRSR